jgi:hypothetical protein
MARPQEAVVRKTDYLPGADAGKNAHYLVRWITSRGDAGPWSETASATIAG